MCQKTQRLRFDWTPPTSDRCVVYSSASVSSLRGVFLLPSTPSQAVQSVGAAESEFRWKDSDLLFVRNCEWGEWSMIFYDVGRVDEFTSLTACVFFEVGKWGCVSERMCNKCLWGGGRKPRGTGELRGESFQLKLWFSKSLGFIKPHMHAFYFNIENTAAA